MISKLALIAIIFCLLFSVESAQYERIDIDELQDEEMQDIVYEVYLKCKAIFAEVPNQKDSLSALLFVDVKKEDGLWFKFTWESFFERIFQITVHIKPDQSDDHLRFPEIGNQVQQKPSV